MVTRYRLGQVTAVGEAARGVEEALEGLGSCPCIAWERLCDQAKANLRVASAPAKDFSANSCEETSPSDHAVTDVLAP